MAGGWSTKMASHSDSKTPTSTCGSLEGIKLGETFTFLPQGAILQNFSVNGHNIVQGFPDPVLYEANNSAFFGETIGRTNNRIKNAILRNLNGGKTYFLAANEGSNNLHGGLQGWGKKRFQVKTEGTKSKEREAIEFSYVSKDGEEGFPGTVECRVLYRDRSEEGRTVLEVDYEVELIGDDGCEETIVSLTNHRYRIYPAFLFRLNVYLSTITSTVISTLTHPLPTLAVLSLHFPVSTASNWTRITSQLVDISPIPVFQNLSRPLS